MNDVAVFGGGCFWCTEAIFARLKGVHSVTPGYAGGKNPTQHAEVVKIEFDPKVMTYDELLDIFFHLHDPTTLNRQGNDIGTQYRSIILTTNKEHAQKAKEYMKKLQNTGSYQNPIVTQIQPLDKFYEAEEYHKNYYDKNSDQPYCSLTIGPKLKHLEELYASKLK